MIPKYMLLTMRLHCLPLLFVPKKIDFSGFWVQKLKITEGFLEPKHEINIAKILAVKFRKEI